MSKEDRAQRAARVLAEARKLLAERPERYVPPPEPPPRRHRDAEFVPEPAPERPLDMVPPQLVAHLEQRFEALLEARLAQERLFAIEVTAQVIADTREIAENQLAAQVRTLRAEIVEAEKAVVHLRAALDTERGRIVDLPNPLQRRELN